MDDRFHVGTFLWGVVLTITGAALATIGFGWWDLSSIDLRYVAPVFVILVGVVILLASLMPGRSEDTDTKTSA
jgi:membrane protein DedA with SNARE-associated domain